MFSLHLRCKKIYLKQIYRCKYFGAFDFIKFRNVSNVISALYSEYSLPLSRHRKANVFRTTPRQPVSAGIVRVRVFPTTCKFFAVPRVVNSRQGLYF